MESKCDSCNLKHRCGHRSRSIYFCKKHQKIPVIKPGLFNSKKYARNPRLRGYMLLKRKFDGTIYALADRSFAVEWNTHWGIMWADYINAKYYEQECKKWQDYDPKDKVFVARVGMKRCPIAADFVHAAPRSKHGNILFTLKDNADEYYKSITHLPV